MTGEYRACEVRDNVLVTERRYTASVFKSLSALACKMLIIIYTLVVKAEEKLLDAEH